MLVNCRTNVSVFSVKQLHKDNWLERLGEMVL